MRIWLRSAVEQSRGSARVPKSSGTLAPCLVQVIAALATAARSAAEPSKKQTLIGLVVDQSLTVENEEAVRHIGRCQLQRRVLLRDAILEMWWQGLADKGIIVGKRMGCAGKQKCPKKRSFSQLILLDVCIREAFQSYFSRHGR